MLAGSGTAGAYQAGVLRALHEAGIKIDLVAGRGAGVIGAMFAAMDGGARLWDDNGVWRRPAAATFYRWRRPLRIAGWALGGCGRRPGAADRAAASSRWSIALAGMLLTFVGLESAGTAANAAYSRWIETLFAPTARANLRPAAGGARGARRRGRGSRGHRGVRLFEPRQAPIRPRARRTAHRRAAVRRRRSSSAAARSSGT